MVHHEVEDGGPGHCLTTGYTLDELWETIGKVVFPKVDRGKWYKTRYEDLLAKTGKTLVKLGDGSSSDSSNGGKNSNKSDKRREAEKVEFLLSPRFPVTLSGSKR